MLFVLFFAIAFAQLPQTNEAACTAASGVWNNAATGDKCTCPTTGKKYVQGTKCVEACDVGSGPNSTNVCVRCATQTTNKLYDIIVKQCVATCPDTTEEMVSNGNPTGFCGCKQATPYIDLDVAKKCVQTCPAGKEPVTYESAYQLCSNPQPKGLPQTNKTACEAASGVWTDTATGDKCKCPTSGNKYVQGAKCVTVCEVGYGPNSTNICAKCGELGTNTPYYNTFTRQCVATCQQGAEPVSVGAMQNICNCKAETPIIYLTNMSCLASCPPGTKETSQNGMRMCTVDSNPNPSNQTNTTNTTNSTNSTGLPQTDKTACEAASGVWTDTATGDKCKCPANKQYYDGISTKKGCVAECPTKTEANDKKVCQKCDLYNSFTKKCVKQCPEGSKVVEGICKNDTDKPYYDETTGKFVASCPAGTENKNNVCVKKANNGINGLFVVLAMILFFIF